MVNHIEVVEKMMFALANHTVDGIRIHPTLSAAKEALKKREPEKIKFKNGMYLCPACGNFDVLLVGDRFCVNCGQALKWGEYLESEVED